VSGPSQPPRTSAHTINCFLTYVQLRAAPGNKTTFISALMQNKGHVHAFERSHPRFKTLEAMLERAGCLNVDAKRADFMESKPGNFENVTRM